MNEDYLWEIKTPHGYLERYSTILNWLHRNIRNDNDWQFYMNNAEKNLCPRFKNKGDALWFWMIWG